MSGHASQDISKEITLGDEKWKMGEWGKWRKTKKEAERRRSPDRRGRAESCKVVRRGRRRGGLRGRKGQRVERGGQDGVVKLVARGKTLVALFLRISSARLSPFPP